MKLPFCPTCKHFDKDNENCKAYPDGIPKNLYWGINYHLWPRKEQAGEYIYQSFDSFGFDDSIYEIILSEKKITELKQKINVEAERLFNKINNLSLNEFKGFELFLEKTSSDLIVIKEKLLLFIKVDKGAVDNGNELISIGLNPKLYSWIDKLLLHSSSVEDINYLVYRFSGDNNKGEFKYYKSSEPSYTEYKKVSSEYNKAKHRLENYRLSKQGHQLLTGKELVKFVEQKISKESIDVNKNKWSLLNSFRRNKYIVNLSELERLIGVTFY